MRIDYHMHFEYGSYDIEWVQGFFDSAKLNEVDEIGISEHTHGFVEFENLYYDDLILDESYIGEFQKKWLKKNKFKATIDKYVDFINGLKEKGYPVKLGMEVCNFKNQEKVKEILDKYEFDYIIASIHFIDGWGYDFSEIKDVWNNWDLEKLYDRYVSEIERIAKTGMYDILGHPFNIRLFGNIPEFDTSKYLERAAIALKKAGMAVDINTGTLYRYPIKEISPYGDFMKMAKKYELPVVLSSDAHKPEDCGRYIAEAAEYAKKYGFDEINVYNKRNAEKYKL